MALIKEHAKTTKKENTQAKAEKVFGGNTNNTTNNGGATMDGMFGFDFMPGLFKTEENGSELTNKFAEAIKKVNAEPVQISGIEINTRVFKLDNAIFQELPYSFVIVATKTSKANEVAYHAICLEATGRKPVNVSAILEEIKFKNTTLIYTPADTFDEILKQTAEKILQDAYGQDATLIPTEGLVVPYDADPETVGSIAGILAYNANIGKLGLRQGLISYINLPTIVQNAKNTILQLDVTMQGGVTQNAVGRPIRSDFELDLFKSTNVNIKGTMPRSVRSRLTTAVGYLDFLVDEVPVGVGMPPKRVMTPMIIVDEMHAKKPTTDMMLLNLINSAAFANQNLLFRLLTSVNRDLGVLNVLVNLDGDKSGFGKKIKLKDGKLTDDKVMQILSSLVALTPVMAVEVELFGPNYSSLVPFAALNNPATRAIANNDIVSIAEKIVGQPLENKNVAANEGIVLPLGEWVDNNGTKRDIREIDLAFVLENTNDINLVFKFLQSNVPASISGFDPYLLRLEVINALIPNAVITGKAVRIPINPAFLNELVNKAMAAGYNPRADIGNVGFNAGFNNLQAVIAAYSNAKLNNINFGYAGYQQQPQFVNPGFNTFGYGR